MTITSEDIQDMLDRETVLNSTQVTALAEPIVIEDIMDSK